MTAHNCPPGTLPADYYPRKGDVIRAGHTTVEIVSVGKRYVHFLLSRSRYEHECKNYPAHVWIKKFIDEVKLYPNDTFLTRAPE